MSSFVDRRAIPQGAAPIRDHSFGEFAQANCQIEEADGSPTWLLRGANFIVAATRVHNGTVLARTEHPDEYMVIAPPEMTLHIAAGGAALDVKADSLTIVPPGDSAVTAKGEGYVYRIFSCQARDLATHSANAEAYADGAPEVAPLEPWPDPVGGFRLHTYPLDDLPPSQAFGRIFRSTNLMVNLFEPFGESRPQDALSPHHHDDFEQGSLCLAGEFEHYLRAPWDKDRAAWKPDVTVQCDSPSLTVIPARTIHTTAWFGPARMVDIFAPPRVDFSEKPGWVRNAADYPMPRAEGPAE
ncbi:MAG: hypothetical protein JWR80_880 [Bradyrhizobium sp.]|nr:hypothetical protein [Bradyrhizobium sp.]